MCLQLLFQLSKLKLNLLLISAGIIEPAMPVSVGRHSKTGSWTVAEDELLAEWQSKVGNKCDMPLASIGQDLSLVGQISS